MRKYLPIIVTGYAIIFIFTLLSVLISGRQYSVYINNPYKTLEYTIEYTDEGIIENTDVSSKNDIVRFDFKGVKKGSTSVFVKLLNVENSKEYTGIYYAFSVLPTGVLYSTGSDFGGYHFVILGMLLMTSYTLILLVKQLKYRKKTQFFSYKTVLDLALVFFFGLQSIMYAGLYGACMLQPWRFDSYLVYNLIGFIMTVIFFISIPFIVIFAGFITISNLSLIRHEGLRKNNLYGIFISLVLFAGSLLCVITAVKYPNTTGFTIQEIKEAMTRTILSTGFVYFECILLATQLCTFYAAKHKPKYNQDFIMILGCKVRNDGTPTPLLRGRIDKAIEFYRKQTENGEKEPAFIPSGGKGNDEVISEAECMKNYLVEHGIDENIIIPETESTTTLENMLFSKKIAEEHMESPNILFSTTNYHIFRSGILSAKAGLRADGIGAKTRWYFWPNAQMREFIGLMASEWKINVLFILVSVGLSVLFANISTIINVIVKLAGI